MTGEEFASDLIVFLVWCGLISVTLLAAHFVCSLMGLLPRKRSPPRSSITRTSRGHGRSSMHRGEVDAHAALRRAASVSPKPTHNVRREAGHQSRLDGKKSRRSID